MTDFDLTDTSAQISITVETEGQGTAVLLTTVPEYELVLAANGMPGPPGPTGPAGPTGPQGPHGAGAEQRTYQFAEPVDVWSVTHDLIVEPDIVTRDMSGHRWLGDESYPTPTTVRIEWAYPMAGTLYLSG